MTRARIVLAVTGFATAAVGVLRDDHRIVWVAIGLVGAAAALRLVGSRWAK